jgi:F0F1-type ATP synthase assembly protein I
MLGQMSEPENNLPKRTYKWPWFVLAFVVLGIVLAVFWVALAARKIEQQRDYNAPLPSSAPAR